LLQNSKNDLSLGVPGLAQFLSLTSQNRIMRSTAKWWKMVMTPNAEIMTYIEIVAFAIESLAVLLIIYDV